MKNIVWFITGASKGIGLSITKYLLNNNFIVAATSRTIEGLEKAVGIKSENFYPIQMDLRNEEDVKCKMNNVVDKFGEIDIVVNNAGYGMIGYLEEMSNEEIKNNFDINVFGTVNVIKAALPIMRKQKNGYIFNVCSIAGFIGMPETACYSGTKFAIDGISNALSKQMKQFNWDYIKVTSLKLGSFRTEFLGESLQMPEKKIPEYNEFREKTEKRFRGGYGREPGDPNKLGPLLVKLTEAENPPDNLYIGKDAYYMADEKNKEIQKDLDDWRELATSTNIE